MVFSGAPCGSAARAGLAAAVDNDSWMDAVRPAIMKRPNTIVRIFFITEILRILEFAISSLMRVPPFRTRPVEYDHTTASGPVQACRAHRVDRETCADFELSWCACSRHSQNDERSR